MSLLKSSAPCPGDLYITEELARRSPGAADYLREKRALQDLAVRMTHRPEEVLPHFVDLAMEMTGGVSAGLSLYEGDEKHVFRWCYLRGALSSFEGATTPRHHSPCGVTVDRNAPVLTRHPERYYEWIADAGIAAPEVLLVPLYLGSSDPLGTLWILSDHEGHFNSSHARTMMELAAFVGAALCMLENQRRLQRSLEEQERLAAEMEHRIKNLFAVAESMIRTSARSASSKEEMAVALSGRLHALSSAHSLVWHKRRDRGGGLRTAELAELMEALLKPHGGGDQPRYSLQGPDITCSEKAIESIALVVHELATNAAKHGALKNEGGHIDVYWRHEGTNLVLRWIERGGPRIEHQPRGGGYGSKLVHAAITRQFGGCLHYDWRPDGLAVTITLPTNSLLK